jgi:hypothetical protein
MTRDEAIKCIKKHIPELSHAHKIIDFYIEVGMLEVEKEKTAREKAIDELKSRGISPAGSIVEYIEHAGLEIVEKKK